MFTRDPTRCPDLREVARLVRLSYGLHKRAVLFLHVQPRWSFAVTFRFRDHPIHPGSRLFRIVRLATAEPPRDFRRLQLSSRLES
jgi:hypothetical protein